MAPVNVQLRLRGTFVEYYAEDETRHIRSSSTPVHKACDTNPDFRQMQECEQEYIERLSRFLVGGSNESTPKAKVKKNTKGSGSGSELQDCFTPSELDFTAELEQSGSSRDEQSGEFATGSIDTPSGIATPTIMADWDLDPSLSAGESSNTWWHMSQGCDATSIMSHQWNFGMASTAATLDELDFGVATSPLLEPCQAWRPRSASCESNTARSQGQASASTTASPNASPQAGMMMQSDFSNKQISASAEESMQCVGDEEVTTLMICNLPCRVAQADMARIVDELGYAGTYNFLRLPTSRGKSNLGYGFINFPDPQVAANFSRSFLTYEFQGTSSRKTPMIRPARLQGIEANMCQFDRTRRDRTKGTNPRGGRSGNEGGALQSDMTTMGGEHHMLCGGGVSDDWLGERMHASRMA
jgi:hypothetical protein